MANTVYTSPTAGNVTIATNVPSYSISAGTGVTLAADLGYSYSTAATWNASSPKIQLDGEGADIEINGQSLVETLQAIKETLLIPDRLNRNESLEQDFAELKAAADHYNTLLEKYKEQKKVFDILKKQDQ